MHSAYVLVMCLNDLNGHLGRHHLGLFLNLSYLYCYCVIAMLLYIHTVVLFYCH